jgi:hypothetical protein
VYAFDAKRTYQLKSATVSSAYTVSSINFIVRTVLLFVVTSSRYSNVSVSVNVNRKTMSDIIFDIPGECLCQLHCESDRCFTCQTQLPIHRLEQVTCSNCKALHSICDLCDILIGLENIPYHFKKCSDNCKHSFTVERRYQCPHKK